MQNKIKNTLEKKLKGYIRHLDKLYTLNKISPVLFQSIKEFVLRKGKRLRPVLLVVGYLGFAKRPAPNLYKTALSIELLHDFMLVHDDIIDKADTRRGEPSMHQGLNNYLKRFGNIKFNGQDLTIVAGDVMYAMAIDTFLSIKEEMQRKEKALRKFIRAAVYTGIGEFIELLNGIKDIEKISKQDIYKIYDYKTAHYTFACPLSAGAILAGASKTQVDRLYQYGIYLGRAFQIKDDILGAFSDKKTIGKSEITDLQEAKKTLLVWYAYNHSSDKDRLAIKNIFAKDKVNKQDLLKMRAIVKSSGALDYARQQISRLMSRAQASAKTSQMRPKYKSFLNNYSRQLLSQ
jgi:geranylgeranyl diphosphate synthase type I